MRNISQLFLAQLCGLSLFMSGCDSNQTKLQWMPDMADNPVSRPQRSYLDPPDHAIAMNSIEYPSTPDDAEKLMQNPIPASAQVIEQGQQLFQTFCTPCHGADAKGEGTLRGLFPKPPDITSDVYAKRQDGFFFHRITFGSAIMPSYGHSITVNERWKIVHYLKTLQKRGN